MMEATSKRESALKSGLTAFLGGPDGLEAYLGLRSREERVAFVYNCPMVRSLFRHQARAAKEAWSERCKCNRESRRLRELGNAAFKSGRDAKALELYSEAVAHADPSEGEAYAMALANRSAVTARLSQTEWATRAIADIDRALRAGHPAPVKLLERKITCLERIGDRGRIIATIDEAFASHDALLTADKREAFRERRRKAAVDAEEECAIGCRSGSEDVAFEPNHDFPSLSEAVEVRRESGRGRFGVARRDISVGEVLVWEPPVDAKLKRAFSSSHCEHCLRNCDGFQLPCPRCTESRFCGESCLAAAEATYHRWECSFVTKKATAFFEDFLAKGKDGGTVEYFKLLLKLVARKPPAFFLGHPQWVSRSPNEEEAQECFAGGSYRGLFSLVRHAQHDSPLNSFWLILSAVFHLRTLQLSGYFGNPHDALKAERIVLSPQEIFLGTVLVDLLQLLRYNTHAVLENRSGREWKMQIIGTAIYPTLALLNHSCDPNIVKYFRGSSVVAVANRNIRKGEEVCENYFPTFTHMDRGSRQDWLLEHYRFLCECRACVHDFTVTKGTFRKSDDLRVSELLRKVAEIKAEVEGERDNQALERQLHCLVATYSQLCNLLEPYDREMVACRDFYGLFLNRLLYYFPR